MLKLYYYILIEKLCISLSGHVSLKYQLLENQFTLIDARPNRNLDDLKSLEIRNDSRSSCKEILKNNLKKQINIWYLKNVFEIFVALGTSQG